MRLITEIEDDIEMMRLMYQTADIVAECMTVNGIMEIRSRLPEGLPRINKDDNEGMKRAKTEQIRKMLWEFNKRKAMDLLRGLLNDHPEVTLRLLHSVIILDEGEDYPHGPKLWSTVMRVFSNEDMLDFFTQLAVLGLTDLDGTSQA